MSPNSDVIANANQAASVAKTAQAAEAAGETPATMTEEQKAKVSAWAAKVLHTMNRHNTPFDGRVRAKKVAKARASRKANKKRKLYLRRRDG